MPTALRIMVALPALFLALACEPRPAAAVYGPWEEGLTLAYEDPSQPQPERSANRLQLRVGRSPLTPGAPQTVQLDLASTRGQMSLLVRHQDGGVALVGEDGRLLSQTLPAGFPGVDAWTERGTTFRVLGRGAWNGASILPATATAVGVWVEARSASGPRRRTLYLPNLGEVESQEERAGGWLTVNRLVAYGFTDIPAISR